MTASISSGENPFTPLTAKETSEKNRLLSSYKSDLTVLKAEINRTPEIDLKISKLSVKMLNIQLEFHVNAIGLLKEKIGTISSIVCTKDEEIEAQKGCIVGIQTLLNIKTAECESIQKDLTAAKEACKTTETAMASLQACVLALQDRVKSNETELDTLKEKLTIKERTIQGLNDKLIASMNSLRERDAACELLKSESEPRKKAITLLNTDCKGLKTALENSEAERQSLKDELEALKAAVKEKDETNETLNESLLTTLTNLGKVNFENESLKNQFPEARRAEQIKYEELLSQNKVLENELDNAKRMHRGHEQLLYAADCDLTALQKSILTAPLKEVLEMGEKIVPLLARLKEARVVAKAAGAPAAASVPAAAPIRPTMPPGLAAAIASTWGRGYGRAGLPPAQLPKQSQIPFPTPLLVTNLTAPINPQTVVAATATPTVPTMPVGLVASTASTSGRGRAVRLASQQQMQLPITSPAVALAPTNPLPLTADPEPKQRKRRATNPKTAVAAVAAAAGIAAPTNTLRRKADALPPEPEQRKRVEINPETTIAVAAAAAAPNEDSDNDPSSSSAIDDLKD